jgi:hypothetical protein
MIFERIYEEIFIKYVPKLAAIEIQQDNQVGGAFLLFFIFYK